MGSSMSPVRRRVERIEALNTPPHTHPPPFCPIAPPLFTPFPLSPLRFSSLPSSFQFLFLALFSSFRSRCLPLLLPQFPLPPLSASQTHPFLPPPSLCPPLSNPLYWKFTYLSSDNDLRTSTKRGEKIHKIYNKETITYHTLGQVWESLHV